MGWLIFAALLAGLVRGFSGFGTAMVFLPIASQYLTPFEAIASLAIMEFFGTFAVMRKSWSDADKVDLARLVVGMTIVTPFALLLLAKVGADFYRYSVSILSLILLVLISLGVPVTVNVYFSVTSSALTNVGTEPPPKSIENWEFLLNGA